MDAWFESVVLAMAIAAIGITALGSRYEMWHVTAPVAVSDTRCVALVGDASDHKPKCATTVALEAGSPAESPQSPERMIRN
jgi:hypothetical protein